MAYFPRKRLAISVALALSTPVPPSLAQSSALPAGGEIVAGSGSIASDGKHMTIQQNTDRMIANWQDFSIGAGNSVSFHQPSSSSVALNRVIGRNPSEILGNLNANGQVFLLNANGIVMGEGASVRTGAFVASTLGMHDEDFLSGQYRFTGDSGSITNLGDLEGGVVALISPTVRNRGAITGDTALAAGTDVLLDFNGDGLLSVEVKASTLETLIDNKGLIQADGGMAILTAKGASAALKGVVNNSGTVQAQTLAEKDGRILLLGDLEHGEVNVAGTLDASAPNGGDGGFIETSAAHVHVDGGARITTLAEDGETGTWLIDPTDFTISAGSAAQTDSGIGADTLSGNLASTNVTLATVDTGDEPGNIYVDATVSWDATTTLTLDADNDIFINAPITVANAGGGLALNYGGSGYHLGAPVSFTAGSGGSFSVNGNSYTLIHDVNQLQAMNNDLTGLYALATDIDASATAGWNSGRGFMPVGNVGTSTAERFNGTLDGLGHVISDLTIDRPGRNHTGLFGYTYYADIRHVGLENAQVTGNGTVGALVGRLQSGSAITQSYATGTVTGTDFTGGLVGYNSYGGSIVQSYSTVTVAGTDYVGGLAGYQNNDGLIHQSYATGSVTGGANNIGGLVGAGGGPIDQSFFATTDAGGNSTTGGYTNNSGEGRTLAELRTLDTFADWNTDIDARGATGVAWRIYDGHTTPLSRAFLTPLHIDVNDETVTYNGTEQFAAGSHNISESYDSDLLSGTAGYSGSGTNAGNYAIGLEGFYSTQRGYDLVIDEGTLAIAKAAATVTANSGVVTYNGGGQSVSGFTATGLVGGETESVLTNVTTSGGAGKDAGVYTHLASGSDENYELTFVSGSLTINKAAATVIANSGTVTYNGSAQSISGFTASGLMGGDDTSVLDGITTSGGAGKNAGVYTHSASGTDENYELTFVNGALTIDKAAATITANSHTVTYNGAEQSTSGFTATGLVGGEDTSVLTGVTTSGGSGKNAGIYTHSASGTDENYELAFVNGALNIDKAAATVTANSDTVTYNGAAQSTSGFTVTGLVGDETDSVLTGVTTSGGSGTNAGTYTHSVSGTDENYEITFVNGALTINKAAATVTANSNTVTYNGSTQSINGFTATGLVGGEDTSVLSGVITSGGSGTNAGTYAHSASGTDGNYELTFIDGALTIDKAALTVTATDASKTYDALAYTGGNGVSYSGFVGGEDELVLGGGLSYGGSAQGATNAGDYTITASGLNADNYTISYVDGTLTIDKAAATVTANSNTVTYNGAGQSVSGFTASGLVGDEDESVLSGVTTNGGSGKNAGVYTHTATGTDENYELTFVDGALTIGKAAATVTANSNTVTYNGGAQSVTGFTTTGLVGGEDESVLVGVSTSGGNGTNAGTYVHTVNGGTQQNYELTFVDGALTIDRAGLTVTAIDAGKTYDALGWSGGNGVSYSGFVGGEDESVLGGSLTYGGSAQGAVNAGEYVITASGLGSNNYNISYADGSLTIDKAAATVTANSDTVTYNGAGQSISGFTATGLVGGEDESVLTGVTASGGTGTNAGVYDHTASGTDENYELTFVDGALTINKAAAIVTANSHTVTYNGTGQNISGFTATGLVSGEDTSVLEGVTTSGGSGKNAGIYTHSASGTDENYELTFVNGALTIDKAAATVTANSNTVTYNGGEQSISGFTASGLVGGEDASVLDGITTSGGSGTNAGSYLHSASGIDENYEFTFVDGTLTIDKAALTVTAADASKTYDALVWSGGSGVSYSGFVSGENETVLGGSLNYGGSAQGAINAGEYEIAVSGVEADNYDITYRTGALTIDKAAATVTANSGTVTYNGGEQSIGGYTASGLVGGEDESVLTGVTTSGGTGTNAGVYSHTASGTDENYELTFVDGALTIDKAAAIVTANSGTTAYNGSEQSLSGFTATGLVGDEDTSVLNGVTTSGGSGKNAGVYTHTATGTDENYELTFVDGALTIDKAAATVTANSDTVTYNGGTQSISGFTVTGLVGGETVSVLTGVTTSGGSGTNAGTFTHNASGTDENYELTFVDGALTIDKAVATVTANSDTVTYNGGAQIVSGFTATGLVDGEDTSVLDGVTTSGGSGTNAGSYLHSASGMDENYELTFVNGALTIDKAALTVTATDASKTYDALAYSGGNGVSYSGFVGGEDETVLGGSLNFGGSAQGAVNAGEYIIAASGLDSNNYNINYVDGSLTINKALATVTANSGTTTYNGSEQSLSGFTATGLVGDEDTSVLNGVTTSGGSGKNAGVYTHTATGTDENYELAFVDGALTIDKAAATVTANSDTVTYNGAGQSINGFTVAGLVGGEDASVLESVITSGGAGTNAGTYVHTANGSDENYDLTFVDGALTIDKAALTVAANDAGKTYDASAWSGGNGVTYSGFVGGEDASVLGGSLRYGGSAQGAINAGSYVLTVSGLSSDNYDFAYADGTLTVNKAHATVTANSGTTTYNGGEQSVSGFTATGLVGGEDESVLDGVITSGGSGTNAGIYVHNASGTDDNYELTFVDGALTIGKAALALNAVSDDKVYDGTTASSADVLVSGLIAGDSLSGLSQSFDSRNAGNRSLFVNTGYVLNDGNGGNNYTVRIESAAGAITPANLLLSAVSDIRPYDGSAESFRPVSVSGLKEGDSVENLNQSFDSPVVGARTLSINPGYIVNDGNNGDNYVLILKNAEGRILTATDSDGGNLLVSGYHACPDAATDPLAHCTSSPGEAADDLLTLDR